MWLAWSVTYKNTIPPGYPLLEQQAFCTKIKVKDFDFKIVIVSFWFTGCLWKHKNTINSIRFSICKCEFGKNVLSCLKMHEHTRFYKKQLLKILKFIWKGYNFSDILYECLLSVCKLTLPGDERFKISCTSCGQVSSLKGPTENNQLNIKFHIKENKQT